MPEAVFAYVKSAERVLDILELVAATPDGMMRGEIADALTIPKSSASILLRSLLARGYLQPSRDGRRLAIGVRAFETGSGFLRQMSLRDLARAAMDELVREFGHTCHLAVLAGRDVVYLDKVDPPRAAVTLVTSVGARLPAAATAVGLAQLAFLDDRELDARYGESPADPAVLARIRASREAIRRRGWASERGETTPGVGCVAAPVFDHAGRPIGAVGATYLEATARGFELAGGPRIRDAAIEISRRSGYAAGSYGDGSTTRHATTGRNA